MNRLRRFYFIRAAARYTAYSKRILSVKKSPAVRQGTEKSQLFCVVDGAGLANHVDLDLAGVIQLVLDLLCDVACQKNHCVVGYLVRVDDDADLAAGLNGKGARNARRFVRDALQLFQTLDVVLDVLAACARTGGGNRVGCLNQAGYNGLGLDVAVVRLDGVDDRRGLLVLLGEIYADLDMAALNLMVDRLADVMQQTCAACRNRRPRPSSLAIIPAICATSMEC